MFEAEKKIRTLSLMQQKALTCATELAFEKISLHDESVVSIPTPENESWLENFMTNVTLEDLSENDASVTFFVAGYIGRSLARRRKCSSCKTQLVQAVNESSPIINSIPEQYKHLFKISN